MHCIANYISACNAVLLYLSKITVHKIMKSTWFIFAGIAVGVFAITGAMVYVDANQQANIPDTAVPQSQAEEGSIISSTGLGPELNREKWHEDPFADIAAEVKVKAGV